MTDLAPDAETETTLHDELASAFNADAEAQGSAPDGVVAPAAIPDPAAETPAQQAERARDEAGRFAKAPEQAQSPPETKTPTGEAEPPATETIRPPPGLSAATKAVFATLPEPIQKDLARLQGEFDNAKATWDQKAERFNRLDSILSPRQQRFQLSGIDEVQAVQALFAAQDLLDRSPVEGLQYLARSYGVNLNALAGQPQMQGQEPPMHPVIQQMAQEVNSLKSALAQQQATAAQSAQTQYQSEIQAFQSDPANLYFENVRGDMANLIRTGQAQGLKDAYEKATWASPEIRPLLLKAQVEAHAAQAQAEARAKVEAARRASGSVIGSPTPGASPVNGAPSATLRDELVANWRSATA